MKKILPTDPEANGLDPIQANLACLRQCFPQAFTEGKVDFEVLKQLLGGAVDESPEKYGLSWNGKRKARMEALKTGTGTLRPAPQDSVAWDSTRNILIEGDNLEVLKLLRNSYANQVKLIYIDPPYNTGHDFIYPDDYHDNLRSYLNSLGEIGLQANSEGGGRFHTAWMNMMYPRLVLAYNLMKNDGVLFISIGDNELKNLLLMVTEIFGEENIIGTLTRVSKKTSNKGQHFAPSKDYVVVCCRDAASLPPLMDVVEEEYANRFKGKDDRGRFNTVGLYQAALDPRPNQRYWVECPDGSFAIPPGNVFPDIVQDASHVVPETSADRVWRWSYDSYLQKKDLLVFKETARSPLLTPSREQSKWNVYTKYYLDDRLKDGSRPRDFIEDATNDKGTSDLKALDMNDYFPFPKPVGLVTKFLNWVEDEDALIMDFFAGSGTTGQAVYEMNVHGGCRRFILVQIPEPIDRKDFSTIAELTKERLRRAAQKIKAEHPEYTGDLGFRVFKLDSSNLKAWDPDTQNVQQSLLDAVEHIKPGRSTDDVLYELLLKLGLDLAVPMQRKTIAGKEVHAIGGGVLLGCLEDGITTTVAEPLAMGMADWHAELKPEGRDTTVVFADSAFDGDVAKSNITAILEQRGLKNVRSV